ncbi:hypothetical protein LINGRAHAP2_LOCUS13063 [Linum grandiflorum]
MASFALKQLIYSTSTSNLHPSPPPLRLHSAAVRCSRHFGPRTLRKFTPVLVPKSSSGNGGILASNDDPEDGVLLGTLKLPGNTDLARFETLMFQWGNSLSQGSNLPFPVPLKVDKVARGARLGFITVDGGETEVPVYIDCLVFPATGSDGPIFRAIRNGRRKDEAAPGEARIMRSLLDALQKSVQIARL